MNRYLLILLFAGTGLSACATNQVAGHCNAPLSRDLDTAMMEVEQRLGSTGMTAIFLMGGILANLIVALRVPQLDTPIIGASGAVSAVVGAYLGLFPGRKIGLFLPLGLYLQFARVPALLVIGSWFTLQLLYTVFGPINGAVAWWTHLAGFALGLSFALLARALAQIRL